MKHITFIFFITILFIFTSCDALRRLAGKPTSADIEMLKVELLKQQEAQKKAMEDSLLAVRKAYQDSLALQDSLMQNAGTILNPAAMGGLYTTKLDYKYYIVIGAFRQRDLAEKLLKKVNTSGYTATLISFRNGFNAIGLSPTNNLNNALATRRRLKTESFCPEDVWILVNE